MWGVTDDLVVDFKCNPLDVFCSVMQTQTNWLADVVNSLAEAALGDRAILSGGLLDTAADQAGMWLGLSVVMMILTSIVGFAVGAVLQRPDMIRRTLFGTLLSFPATMVAFFVAGEALGFVDEVSAGLLEGLTGTEGFAAVITRLMSHSSGQPGVDALATWSPGKAMFVLAVLAVGVVMLAVAMAFRDFAVLLLIAFAPLAFVLLPIRGGEVWVRRWASALTAAILAYPLMLGALQLVCAGFARLDTIWSMATITLSIGLGLVSFLPLAAFSFFSFMAGGGAGDEVGRMAAQKASHQVQRVSHQVQQVLRGGRGGSAAAGGSGAPVRPRPVGGGNDAPAPSPTRSPVSPSSSGVSTPQVPSPSQPRGEQ